MPTSSTRVGACPTVRRVGPGLHSHSRFPLCPGVEYDDDYFWLRDDSRKDREVLGYIREENSYTCHKTRHLKKLRKEVGRG